MSGIGKQKNLKIRELTSATANQVPSDVVLMAIVEPVTEAGHSSGGRHRVTIEEDPAVKEDQRFMSRIPYSDKGKTHRHDTRPGETEQIDADEKHAEHLARIKYGTKARQSR